jgi:hypothetical protein
MSIGFPEYTDSFLSGQDILYTQFNDIEFYVEDTEQEHFYYNILKKLFPDLKFSKIFPLNGKQNVIDAVALNNNNKKKIYLVDLDFDHILSKKVTYPNLFYLERYSIENHLISKSAIYEAIRIKHPKLKDNDIDALFNYTDILKDAAICLKELACSFIINQKHGLGYPYYGLNVNRDFDFTTPTPTYKLNFITDYLNEVKLLLKCKNHRYSFQRQINKLMKYFRSLNKSLENIPGKYVLNFVKERLQSLGLINQTSIESFTYSLSKDFDSNELAYLRTLIINYIR